MTRKCALLSLRLNRFDTAVLKYRQRMQVVARILYHTRVRNTVTHTHTSYHTVPPSTETWHTAKTGALYVF